MRSLNISLDDKTFEKLEKIAILKETNLDDLIKEDLECMIKSFEESFELIF